MKNFININSKINEFNKVINISSDKSISIRCILLASQAIGVSKIYNILESDDVMNAFKAIKKLGIDYKRKKNHYKIYGLGINGYHTNKKLSINAGNSGTLARLILGLLINCKNGITLFGDKSLSKRDFSRVTNPLRLFGANIESDNKKLPVKISGSEFLRPISYFEKLGSAQCKSAVMLAALKCPGITRIKAVKSRNHTELLFRNLKIPIKVFKKKRFDLIEVNGLKNFKGFEYVVPGDISSCSFFLVLTLLSEKSKMLIKNVNVNDTRTGIIKILNKMNANIKLINKKKYKGESVADILVKSKKNLKGINCSSKLNSSAIDEFLIIFLVASKAKGISSFYNLSELNKKESPRLDIAVKILKKIGVKIIRKKDNLKIFGDPELKLKGKYIIKNFRKDHRVVMMSCIAALTLGGKWKISDKNSVNTSFPNFFKIIKSVGARIH